MTDDSSGPKATSVPVVPGAWTFFRQWLKNPRATAALTPSGRQLTRQMIAQLPDGARRIVELGAGTGVFTRALIENGVAPDELLIVELNNELARLLQHQFPRSTVVNGDASDLQGIVSRSGFGAAGGVDAVISGLGFLAMPRSLQKHILQSVFAVLASDAPLIQFTYGPKNPLPRDLLDELGLRFRRAGVALLNVPPATVYVYTRSRSTPVHATRAGTAA
ncbi:MAG: phospholipid methyltransferase [Dokdonella sp.]|uniref:class I SAM-dependent methyltransferase n=1 Tax=Dokdonella sp. TaxID=2291710 RepID=UPI00326652B2